jgi:hypothetical protein
MPIDSATAIRQARERVNAIRVALRALDLVCSGTLLERTKTCGKPGCRCANDPAARHGPYFEWTRRKAGKFAHRLLSPQQAQAMRRAIANYHTVQELLKDWETESERLIDAQFPRKS